MKQSYGMRNINMSGSGGERHYCFFSGAIFRGWLTKHFFKKKKESKLWFSFFWLWFYFEKWWINDAYILVAVWLQLEASDVAAAPSRAAPTGCWWLVTTSTTCTLRRPSTSRRGPRPWPLTRPSRARSASSPASTSCLPSPRSPWWRR